jgi:rod shape-determining protein MreD
MISKTSTAWHHYLKVIVYTLFILLLQALWISRMPSPALRADLLLPLMFGVASEWSPLPSLFWAFLWGFVVDTLSGKFWGLHVGSYVVAVSLVNIAAEKFECKNPVYQMGFVGLCALGQSAVLGLYLIFEPSGPTVLATTWNSLIIRSILMTLVSPMILYPIWSSK